MNIVDKLLHIFIYNECIHPSKNINRNIYLRVFMNAKGGNSLNVLSLSRIHKEVVDLQTVVYYAPMKKRMVCCYMKQVDESQRPMDE